MSTEELKLKSTLHEVIEQWVHTMEEDGLIPAMITPEHALRMTEAALAVHMAATETSAHVEWELES